MASKWLPAHDGLLPYWLLLTSAASIFNTVGCYVSTDIARRTYQGPVASTEVTGLSGRLFGTWTLLATVIRSYAAYRIASGDIYTMAFWTYAIALGHFSTEWLAYGTASMRKGLAVPFTVAFSTTVWMWSQWDFYVKA